MAGAICPKCGEMTLWQKPFGKECSRCGYRVYRSINSGKGGKGSRCPLCGKYTFFDGRCSSCGAHE